MAIKFPLEMKDGAQVRNIMELKENFDIEKIIGYFLDGKLLTWLEARYYEEEAEAVSLLEENDSKIASKLCEIFGVEYECEKEIDTEELVRRNERIAKLKQFTDNDEVIENIDSVAFNQEELADLYDRSVQKIYLCEGNFSIPKSKRTLEYVLIGDIIVDGLAVEKEVSVGKDILENSNDIYDNSYETEEVNADGRLRTEFNKISNELKFMKQKVKEGNPVCLDTAWDSSYRFVFKHDASKASDNRRERMESEYRTTIEKYATTIADNYLEEITENINQYIERVRTLFLGYNKVVDNIKVEVSLEQGKIITIALSDVTLPQSTQNKIHSYIDDICKSEIRQLSGVPLIFTTVDDREVYDGESIFGRSKYVKKYNYTLDNVDEVKERLQKELIKLTDIIYSKQILNSIYMKIAKALEDVLPK